VWGMCMPSWGAAAAITAFAESTAGAKPADAAKPRAKPAATPKAEKPKEASAFGSFGEPAAKAEELAEPKQPKVPKQPSAEPAVKAEPKAEPKPADSATPAAAAPPCPTKPFGQCAGMNFTQPDVKLTYNYSSAAQAFACCPPGTACVSFGPVWGMCMPSMVPDASGP